MSLIDLFKWFHYRSTLEGFPPSARVLYFVLLGEFNARFWQNEISYSERELSGLTGLSNASVHRAIKFLADRAYIKTWRKGNRTIFRLLDVVPESSARSETTKIAAQSRSEVETQTERSAVFAIPATREDLRQKTEDNNVDDVDAGARILNEVDELVEYWERDLRGGRLSFEHMSELSVWVKTKGKDFVKETMREASDSNGISLNMKLLRKVLETKANPQPLKGGEKVGKADRTVAEKAPTQIEYKEPDYNSAEYDELFGRTRKPDGSC